MGKDDVYDRDWIMEAIAPLCDTIIEMKDAVEEDQYRYEQDMKKVVRDNLSEFFNQINKKFDVCEGIHDQMFLFDTTSNFLVMALMRLLKLYVKHKLPVNFEVMKLALLDVVRAIEVEIDLQSKEGEGNETAG